MATPQSDPQGRQQKPKRHGGGTLMLLGLTLASIGVYLDFQSYSNDPSEFYIGVALLVAGVLMLFIPAIMRRDKPRSRQPNGNGNRAA